MSTTEARNILIQHLQEIEDPNFLQALIRIIEQKFEQNNTFSTSKIEEAFLLKGLEDINSGRVVSNEEVKKNIESWLFEK